MDRFEKRIKLWVLIVGQRRSAGDKAREHRTVHKTLLVGFEYVSQEEGDMKQASSSTAS